jgi:hypothetical protein
MADTDQAASTAADSGVDGSGEVAAHENGGSAAPVSYSEVVWAFGDILSPSNILPVEIATIPVGNGDLLLATTVSSEAPGNLDHALDQLTTTIDLFDVPVLDFHSA